MKNKFADDNWYILDTQQRETLEILGCNKNGSDGLHTFTRIKIYRNPINVPGNPQVYRVRVKWSKILPKTEIEEIFDSEEIEDNERMHGICKAITDELGIADFFGEEEMETMWANMNIGLMIEYPPYCYSITNNLCSYQNYMKGLSDENVERGLVYGGQIELESDGKYVVRHIPGVQELISTSDYGRLQKALNISEYAKNKQKKFNENFNEMTDEEIKIGKRGIELTEESRNRILKKLDEKYKKGGAFKGSNIKSATDEDIKVGMEMMLRELNSFDIAENKELKHINSDEADVSYEVPDELNNSKNKQNNVTDVNPTPAHFNNGQKEKDTNSSYIPKHYKKTGEERELEK